MKRIFTVGLLFAATLVVGGSGIALAIVIYVVRSYLPEPGVVAQDIQAHQVPCLVHRSFGTPHHREYLHTNKPIRVVYM